MLRTDLIRPLPETIRAHVDRFADKVAFRDSRRAVTYAELERRTGRLAGQLTELRLQPGDRAAIYLGNRVEMVETYLAITRASAIGVPLDPRSTDAELMHLLDDSGARVIITDPAHLGQLGRVLGNHRQLRVVLTEVDVPPVDAPSGTVAFEALIAAEPAVLARDDLGLDDVAWMLYTSGTTGKPKGVLSTQRNCLWSVAACYVPVPGLSAADRVVWPLPLFHSLSHIVCILGVTSVGASAHIVDGFAADDVLDAVRVESATFLAGVPTMYHYLVRAAQERGFEAPQLRMCLVGGAVTTATLRGSFERLFGSPLLDAYGSTETCGSITINWPTGARLEGSCGLPVPGLGVRVVDPDTGIDCADTQEGEVWVRGPSVMVGYHNQPEATTAAMRDGWYRTGDLARRDEAGYFTITGRIKELIIRGGENIHPGEVEEVLRAVPGVSDVAVVGKPHEVLGEVPVAFIVSGPAGVDSDQLFATCRERLAYFKIPEELYEIDRIPRTASGKITRHVLLDRPARLRAASSGHFESLFLVDWMPAPALMPGQVPGHRWALAGGAAPVLAGQLTLGGHEADGYPALGDVPVDGPAAPEVIVLCWAEKRADAKRDPDQLAIAIGESVRELAGQVDAYLSRRDNSRLVVLTRNAVAVTAGDPVDLAGAPLWGWLRGVHTEHPDRVVLVDADGDDPLTAAALPAAVMGDAGQVAIRDGVVFIPRLARASASGPEVPALLDPQGTVLVTGAGMPRVGALARHLAAAHGARHFVLVGPHGRRDPSMAELAEELSRPGAEISVVAGEVDARSLGAAISALKRPLTAVLHDIGQPDTDDLMRSSVAGALRLHELTRHHAVRSFVLMSSPAGLLGAAARLHEAVAGAFAHALAHHRRILGLAATTVALAGDDGPAGFGALTPQQSLAAFDAAPATGWPFLVAGRIDAGGLTSVPPILTGLVEPGAPVRSADGTVTARLRDRLASLAETDRVRALTELVMAEVSGLRAWEGGQDTAFRDRGFTSVDAVELRNRLTAATGLRLPATLAFDYPAPAAVVRCLNQLLFGTPVASGPAATVRTRIDEPIAIVGMGCRLPGGVASADGLWDLVAGGVDAISGFPTDRGWDVESLFDPDPDRVGKSYVREGGFLYDAPDFDAGFFGISPREALAMDPQQRLLLETAWETFEHAGIDPLSLKGGSVGVFTGVMYKEYGTQVDQVPADVEGYLGIGSANSVVSGRVAYSLGFEGPAMTVDTACSSSLVALHVAASSLRSGDCDMALVGGVAVMTLPTSFVEFSRQRGLAADGRCKAFGAGADGTAWSEGVALLLVERLSDAQRFGHRVLAVVRGSAVNQDGASNGLTAPNGPSQQRVIRAALASAGLTAAEVDAVEAHGTGTTLGDPIEAQALLATYGQGRTGDQPLWLGSLKSNIGHAQAAAGVAGVIKMVQAMRHGVLPRTLHADEPSSHVDWSSGAVELLTEAREWPDIGRPRRAGVSSFGVSGTNAHVILEQAPESESAPVEAETRLDVVPLAVSARSPEALRVQAHRLADWLAESDVHLRDVGWSLASTRAQLEHRAVVLACDRDEAVAALRALDGGETVSDGELGLLFTGQGAQRPGMGAGLYRAFPVFAAVFDEVCAEFDQYLDRPLQDVIFGESGSLLAETAFTQPALFAVEVAAARLVESWGIRPTIVVGHSIGELAAAHIAGVFGLAEAVRLVAARARLMQALPVGGAMVAVMASEEEITPLLTAGVEIAAINGSASLVLSGVEAEVLAIAEKYRHKRLAVSHAFHSPLMDPVLEEFRRVAEGVEFHWPRIRFVSTVTGQVEDEALTTAGYWVDNIRRTVRFADAIGSAGAATWLEVGPGGVLTALAEGAVAMQRPGTDEVRSALTALGVVHARGHHVDWRSLFDEARVVDLPTYAFQRQRFWLMRGIGSGVDELDHSLLSSVVRLPESGGVVCLGRLSLAAHPWLADHEVAGRVILPGAALVEMAIQAGGEVGAGHLDELIIETPVLLGDVGTTQLQITVDSADDTGRRPIVIHSRSGQDKAWTRHATGTVSAADPPAVELGEWPPANAVAASVDGFYARRAAEGLVYGPSFQGLQRMWIRGEQIFAEITLPDGDVARFGIHPALLDAALHATPQPDQLMLPFAWTDVALHASAATRLRVMITPIGPGTVSLRLADPTGAPVATIGSLTFQAPVVESSTQDDLYRVDWAELPVTEAGGPKRWTAIDDVVTLLAAVGDGAAVPALALMEVGHASSVEDMPERARALTNRVLGELQRWLAEPVLESSRLVLVTRGAIAVHAFAELEEPAASAVWGLVRVAQSEHPDRLVIVDLDDEPESVEALTAAVATGEPQLAVRSGVVMAPRLVRLAGDELRPPSGVDTWRLHNAGSTVEELTLVPAPEADLPLGEGQVRIAVRAAGVNFRDVLVALGMVPGQEGLGGEAAGVVLEVGPGVTELRPGDRVMGMLGEFGGFGPVAVTDHRLVVRMPAGWSFAQAASVPIVFLTAYYGLRDLAGLRAGERILVNAAAGGVGMAAVQLAQHFGATVYGTASQRKWPALRRLGVDGDRLASSRTTAFEQKFLKAAGGEGMDVVLNSLAGEFTDASLALLPRGGRFLELGKTDIRDASQVASSHPNVSYQAYDLREAGPDRTRQILAELVELFESGAIMPLPVTAWDVRRASDAFRHLSQARHTGKVVLTVPRDIDPQGTVLISGAGALGGLVARELVRTHGVRRLILTSRRGRASGDTARLESDLAELGAETTLLSLDGGDRDQVAELLSSISAEHPLTAVVHTAGVLNDGVITALDPQRVGTVFRPKVDAAWHLHELTADLDLAAFVLFSSAAGVFGNPGQGNYAAANGFLDGLAQRRRAGGLPATSLAWGLWAEASELTANLDDVAFRRTRREGMLGLAADDGIRLFNLGLRASQPALVPARLDLRAATRQPLLRGLARPARRTALASSYSDGELARRLSGLAAEEQERVLVDLVRSHAAAVVGHTTADLVDADRAFKDIGFDSLTAVELRNRLGSATALRLGATVVFDYPNPTALARHLRTELSGENASTGVPAQRPAFSDQHEPIAIVGMSCRFPADVNDPEDLWRLLEAGREVVSEFPEDRGWDVASLFDPDPDHPGTTYVRRGGFLTGMAHFDAGFFGISPREAVAMDPQQRLLLETSWEAFEHAGIDPTSFAGHNVGVFAGVINHDYTVRLHQAPGDLEGYRLTGSSGSVASGRVAYSFGFEGPAITVDTACSSSLVALHLAVRSLRSGECDLALAGGVTVMTTADNFVEFSRQRGLAVDGRCKAFGAGADGTAWSEGVGLLLVERLSDAQRLGHRVLAVVRGSAVNQDGASNGLTAPNGPSQQRVIHAALADAGLTAGDVDAVEAHGTGTTLGDPIEAQALLATYGQGRAEGRSLWLGSLKSNLGHTQGAAGVASVIKMVQAMRHGVLPRTLHAEEPSPHVDWSTGAVRLLTDAQEWPDTHAPRRAGVSSFGVGGTNAHVILEQAPEPESAPIEAETRLDVVPLVVSARSPEALRAQAQRLADSLAENDLDLRDVGWSLASTRALLEQRAVVVAADRDEAIAGLRALDGGEVASGGGLGLLFTGQGAQRLGMGLGLYQAFPAFAAAFDQVCAEFDQYLDRPLTDVIFGESGALLDQTAYTQPALFAVEVATARLVESWGVKPTMVIGHSIGELAAAHIAGVLGVADAVRLVAARSGLMQALPTGGAMVAVQASEEEVIPVLTAGVEIAAINGPTSVVLSGVEAGVLAIAEKYRHKRLTVSHAFHSPLMDPMLEEFRRVAESVEFRRPRIRFVSTVTGQAEDDALTSPAYWVANVRRTVRFADAVGAAGAATWVEVGPGGVLTALTEDAVAMLRPGADEVRSALTAVGRIRARGHPVDWQHLFGGARVVDLPTYAFQRRRFWLPERSGPSGLYVLDHPLLESVMRLGSGGVVCLGRLSLATHAWLADHEVAGRVILPGAALVEMAIRVGDEVGASHLDELIIETPVVLSDTATVQLQVIVDGVDGAGRRPIAIHSRSRDDEAWTRHAAGSLSATDPPTATPTEWPPTNAVAASVDGFYARRAAEGLVYGPDFQGLQCMWTRGQEVFAEITLPDVDVSRFGIHPALLDASLHAIATGGGLMLPFAWTNVALHAAAATALRVTITPTGTDTVSLRLSDPTGAPVATIGGLVLRALNTERLGERDKLLSGLSRLDWIPLTSSAAPPADWAVVGAGLDELAVPRRFAELAAMRADEPVPDVVLVEIAGGDIGPAGARVATGSVLKLLREWLAEPAFESSRLVVVTRGMEVDPAASAVWGLVRTAQSEHPGRFLLVDVDDEERSLAALPTVLAGDEPQVALRGGVTMAPRLVPAEPTQPVPVSFGDGAVLVTGGTGALGAAVTRHLVEGYGVRRLVLVSRRGLSAPGAVELRDELCGMGAEVDVEAVDVGDRAALAKMVSSHRVTGVVHVAGVLADGVVVRLDAARVDRVFEPKVDAAWHLHELTRDLDLSAFVVFSSVAGVVGNPGQGNYSAANAYLDGLARYRRAEGLPAVSLAWGPWELDGSMAGQQGGVRGGLRSLPAGAGLVLFDAALAMDEAVVVPATFDTATLNERAADGRLPSVLRGRVRPPRQVLQPAPASGLAGRLAGLVAAEQRKLLLELVCAESARVLGQSGVGVIRGEQAFKDVGFDSLAAVELRNRLTAVTGVRLPATLVFDYPTPAALSELLLQQLGRAGEPDPESVLAHLEQLERSLDHEARGQLALRLKRLAARWSSNGAPDTADDALDLDAATDEELFELVDNELGRP